MVAMAHHGDTPDRLPDYDENGRRYGGFRRGRYLMPIDEAEKDRLDIFHKLIFLARREKLHDVPLQPGAQVLDIGTGTGIWAIDIADELYRLDPTGRERILGLDLAFIQPQEIPATVSFMQADVEAPWPVAEQTCDMVHIQMMLGSIRDWPDLYRKSFRHLKPGGYIEQVEIELVPLCDDNTLSPDSHVIYWSNTLRRAMYTIRQPIDVFDTKAEFHAAGFTDITESVTKLPVNPWGSEDFDVLIGRWFNLGLRHGLEAMTLAPLTRIEGWQKHDVDGLVESIKREICRLSIHSYFRMYVWTGRKPGQ